MKAVVVGLGSMGKRRIRLIQKIDRSIVIIGVDSSPARCEEVRKGFGITCFPGIEEALSKERDIDCGFVATAPLAHAAIIKQLLSAGLHVFTEINLVSDGYDEFERIKRPDQVLFLSSTFLYRKDIQYLIEQSRGQVVNYCYHTGQYLPDWHPWEKISDFFVKEKRTNGCREIFAIELPWIFSCFGDIKNIYAVKSTLSSLDLGYPDNYMLILEHENGTKGQLSVDVVARTAVRKLEIYNEKLHLFWNGTPESLQRYDLESKQLKTIPTYQEIDKDQNYCDNIIENAYMDEIIAFLDEMKTHSGKMVRHDFKQDQKILAWIDRIEDGRL